MLSLFCFIIRFVPFKRMSRFYTKWSCIIKSLLFVTLDILPQSLVSKYLRALKMYFSPRKIHIFVTSFSYSTLLIGAIQKCKYGNSGETADIIPSFVHECQTLPLQLQLVVTRCLHRRLNTVCIQFSVTS
jgi:hypothetical protein